MRSQGTYPLFFLFSQLLHGSFASLGTNNTPRCGPPTRLNTAPTKRNKTLARFPRLCGMLWWNYRTRTCCTRRNRLRNCVFTRPFVTLWKFVATTVSVGAICTRQSRNGCNINCRPSLTWPNSVRANCNCTKNSMRG